MEKIIVPKSVSQILFRIIGLLFVLCIGFVFGSVFFHNTIYTHDKFIVLITMLVVTIMFVLVEWLLKIISSKLNNVNMKIIIGVYLAVFGIIQIIIAGRLRFVPAYDLGNVYNGAINWLENGTLAECQEYFYYFPNNIGLLCVFRFVFGILSKFGLHDYFMIASCLAVLSLIGMMWAVIAVCRRLFDDKTALRAMFLMLFILPLYIYAAAFYSDVMSVFAVPVIIFFCLKARESKSLTKKIIYFLLMGLVSAVGMKIKFTIVIVMIALFIIMLLKDNLKNLLAGVLSTVLMCSIIFGVMNVVVYPKLLDKDTAQEMNTPYLHWVMMGLTGKGAYNGADYAFTRGFTDTKERDKAIKEEIKKRISENKATGMISLYEEKTVNCFGEGTFCASDFLDDTPMISTSLHKYVLYDGVNYLQYSSVCHGVFLFIMFLMIVSGIKYFIFSSNVEARYLIFALSFLGIWMFLMLWETTGRYFFNYIPVMIIFASVGVAPMVDGLKYIANLFRERKEV